MAADRCKAEVVDDDAGKSFSAIEPSSEPPSNRPVKCRQCNEQFKLYDDLEKHIKQSGHAKPFACELCGRTFNTQGMLDRHSRAKHQPGVKQKASSDPAKSRAAHKIPKGSEKSKGPRYKCPHCDRTFPYYCRLEPHLKWHSKAGSFQCPTCSKTFVWESKLKQHMKMHEDEKPFSCNICGKAFKRNFHLKEHVTGAHPPGGKEAISPASKKFKCTKCSQAYAYRINLTRHMKHHEEKNTTFKTTKSTERKKSRKAPAMPSDAGDDSTVGVPIVKQEADERRSNESAQYRKEAIGAPAKPKRGPSKKAANAAEAVDGTSAVEEPTVKQEEVGTWHKMQSCEVDDAVDTDSLVEDIIGAMKQEVKEEPAE